MLCPDPSLIGEDSWILMTENEGSENTSIKWRCIRSCNLYDWRQSVIQRIDQINLPREKNNSKEIVLKSKKREIRHKVVYK